MKKHILTAALMVICLAGTAEARGSNYVWRDKTDGMSIAFPDSWTLQTADSDLTRMRVAAPVGTDYATCSIRTDQDGRVQIYPKPLLPEAAVRKLDMTFWEQEIARLHGAKVDEYRDGVVIAKRAPATAVKVSYLQDIGNGAVDMNATMVATIHGDKRYVVMCASRSDLFDSYSPTFTTIITSFQLDDKYTPFATGYYRDFIYKPRSIFQKVGDFFTKR